MYFSQVSAQETHFSTTFNCSYSLLKYSSVGIKELPPLAVQVSWFCACSWDSTVRWLLWDHLVFIYRRASRHHPRAGRLSVSSIQCPTVVSRLWQVAL